MRSIGNLALSTLLVMAAALPAAADGTAAPGSPYVPAPPPGRPLDLHAAVRLALEHDPAVFTAREQSRFLAGTARTQTGAFDLVLRLRPSLERSSARLATGRIQREKDIRQRVLAPLALAFQGIADEIQRQLESGLFGPLPECDEDQIVVLQTGTATTVIHCPPPTLFLDFDTLIRIAEGTGQDAVADTIRQNMRRMWEQFLYLSREVAHGSREALRRAGVVPTIEDVDTVTLELDLAKLYRNGIGFAPEVQLTGVRTASRGKSPVAGEDRFVAYTSRIGFRLDIPLGKGRGMVSTGAPERAARENHRAALESEGFVMTQSALRAAVAYWNLAAAQERVRILERSAARERELLSLARSLAEADEIARADLAYVKARVAATDGSVLAARQALVQAQVDLATALGIEVREVSELPTAATSLPDPPAEGDLERWAEEAAEGRLEERRGDVRAAVASLQASSILAAAARADLKRRVDLSFRLWYSGLYEDRQSMSLNHMIYPFSDAFTTGFTGPSAQIALTFSWPFANSAARGRLEESLALYRRARIVRGDVERVARARGAQRLGELRRAVSEVRRLETALAARRRTLDGTRELFRYGQATAVDVVLTEEDLVTTELALVDTRLRTAALQAELLFELGDLVRYHVADGRVVVDAIADVPNWS